MANVPYCSGLQLLRLLSGRSTASQTATWVQETPLSFQQRSSFSTRSINDGQFLISTNSAEGSLGTRSFARSGSETTDQWLEVELMWRVCYSICQRTAVVIYSIDNHAGLLNRLTHQKEQSRGACAKCGYCKWNRVIWKFKNMLFLFLQLLFCLLCSLYTKKLRWSPRCEAIRK